MEQSACTPDHSGLYRHPHKLTAREGRSGSFRCNQVRVAVKNASESPPAEQVASGSPPAGGVQSRSPAPISSSTAHLRLDLRPDPRRSYRRPDLRRDRCRSVSRRCEAVSLCSTADDDRDEDQDEDHPTKIGTTIGTMISNNRDSPRVGRTSQGPPPEAVGLNRN